MIQKNIRNLKNHVPFVCVKIKITAIDGVMEGFL